MLYNEKRNYFFRDEKMKKNIVKNLFGDLATVIIAGLIVGFAYYFFQNDNGFAPGGVGGLATITYYLTGYSVPWAYLMLAFNMPILILLTIFVNKKLGAFLIIYIAVQSFSTEIFRAIGISTYSLKNFPANPAEYNVVFACIATGVISGFGFSIMLRRFGASGGTYAIAALIKKAKPATNVAYVSFLLDSSVVLIAFFVYGMKVTPVLCTLINLFIANIVVDYGLSGIKNGYKFEIITDKPEELSQDLIDNLHHGVTEIKVMGMYSHTDKFMVVCIIRKKQVGEMMKIIKKYPNSFANYYKVNEVFGRFRK